MSEDRPARFPWWGYGLFLVAILFFALAPLGSVYLASFVAEASGCTLNEAAVHPCIVAGMDMGGLLTFMFVMGWFTLATLPLGGGALMVWLASLIIHRIAWSGMEKGRRL